MNRYLLTPNTESNASPGILQAMTLLSLYGEYVIDSNRSILGVLPLRIPQSTVDSSANVITLMTSTAHTSQAENTDKPVVDVGDLIVMCVPASKVPEQRSFLNHFFHFPAFFRFPVLANFPGADQGNYDLLIGISNSQENEFNKPAFSPIAGEIYRVVTSKHIIGLSGGGGGGGVIRPPRQPAFRPIHTHPTL